MKHKLKFRKRHLSDKNIESVASVLYFLTFFAAIIAGFSSAMLFGDPKDGPGWVLVWTFMGGASSGLIVMLYGIQRLKCWLAGESGEGVGRYHSLPSSQSILWGVALIGLAACLFLTFAAWERSDEATIRFNAAAIGLYILLGKSGAAALLGGLGLFMILDGVRRRSD